MEFNFKVWNYKDECVDTYGYGIDYKEIKEKLVEYILSDTKDKMGKDFEEIGALQSANIVVYDLDIVDKLAEYYKDRILEDFSGKAQEDYSDNLD